MDREYSGVDTMRNDVDVRKDEVGTLLAQPCQRLLNLTAGQLRIDDEGIDAFEPGESLRLDRAGFDRAVHHELGFACLGKLAELAHVLGKHPDVVAHEDELGLQAVDYRRETTDAQRIAAELRRIR